jgi:hypothetical protein
MAIAFVDVSTGSVVTQNLTVTLPATVNADDYLLAVISTDWQPQVLSTPSGWTALANASADGNRRMWAYGTKADGTEDGASVVFNGTAGGTGHVWAVLRYSGVDTTTAMDVAAASGTEASTSTPAGQSQTTVTDNAMVVACFGTRGSAGTGTAGGGATERVDSNATASNVALYVEELVKTPAGAVQLPASFTFSQSWNDIQVALRPAADGGGGAAPALRTVQSNLRW